MKKFISGLICFLGLILICGCNTSSKTFAVTSGISFNAEVCYGEDLLEYKVTLLENGDCETEVLDNGIPTGFKTLVNSDGINLTLEDLEHKTSLSALPDGLIIDLFACCFKDAKDKPVKELNHVLYTEGATEKYSYKIYLGETGLPIKIEENNFDISIIIKNASILG